jgi:uncharacterized protein YegP (UPF0339 family)
MKFILRRRADDISVHFWFVIVSGNGETVACSEMYTRKSDARATIDQIKRNVDISTPVEDETLDQR